MGFAGVKVITRELSREPALDSMIMLYDYDKLIPIALMDGSWITTMRTGAVAAHAISVLAKEDFKTVAIMGVGNTGRAAIRVLLAKYKGRELTLKILKYKDQHELLEKMIRGSQGDENPNVDIEFVDNYEQVIKDSDVVISAVTYFKGNFCEDDCFKEGCLIVPIHLRGFMNCDLSFDKVYGDDHDHVKKFKYFDKFKQFAEVAQVIRGEAPGRENNKERIIAYNVGLSMHDMCFAKHVYDFAIKCEGQDISLCPPTEKIWLDR
jgi:ornithine cyclodeaminase/alanine dehydrogenase